jgi:hypothetical protein
MNCIQTKTKEARISSKKEFITDVLPLFRPTIFKGLVNNWPALNKAKNSTVELVEYIKTFDTGRSAITYQGPTSIKGQFFYQRDLKSVNFDRVSQTVSSALDALISHTNTPNPPSLYTGSIIIPDHIPGFEKENLCEFAGKTAIPRIWMGNQAIVPTHYDMLDNIVCVVSGRRRFTLFPPDQLSNLYVGPIDYTLSGQPISLVKLNEPDFEKYPRFKYAMEKAEIADLEPGDALYIPKLWWHHVESFDPINIIVNYWWDQNGLGLDTPFTTLMHGLISISQLPKAERDAWQVFFNHYVFRNEDGHLDHIPAEARGVLGEMTPEIYQSIRNYVINTFRKS